MNRFFKAYFIASLIYAVVFGLLMYGDGLLFSGSECFDIAPLSVFICNVIVPTQCRHYEVDQTLYNFDDSCFAYCRMVDCLVRFFTVGME